MTTVYQAFKNRHYPSFKTEDNMVYGHILAGELHTQ